MGATTVGVGVKENSAVGEILATGESIVGVAMGAAGGAGVNTSTLKVQPEIQKINTSRNRDSFFIMQPLHCQASLSTLFATNERER